MLIRSLGVLLGVFVSLPAFSAEAKTSRIYQLPNSSQLELLAPKNWNDTLRQSSQKSSTAITLLPGEGNKIKVLIGVDGFAAKESRVLDDEEVRKLVADTADRTKPQTVETELPLREIVGAYGKGYYFSATDKLPKTDEYKYLSRGILRLDEGSLSFVVLSNDGAEEEVAAALEMLKTAKHTIPPKPAPIAAPAAQQAKPSAERIYAASERSYVATETYVKRKGPDLRACLSKTDNRAVMLCAGPVK